MQYYCLCDVYGIYRSSMIDNNNQMKSKTRAQNTNLSKYKYSFNQKLYDLHLSSSVDTRNSLSNNHSHITFNQKIKSKPNFSLEKIINPEELLHSKTPKTTNKEDYFQLPSLKKKYNNLNNNQPIITPNLFYQARLLKALNSKDNSYLNNLAKQHFIQTIEALKIGKNMKLGPPQRQIKLSKKHPKFKTIYLDMDQTLIHCEETSNNYTVKLNFPVEGGGIISAGIRIRPYCDQFLKELSSFAEIIIFTASSASYADVVLDHLDPQKKYISHRLYRQHCSLQKQFFTKDLRIVNRRMQDSLIVDNSAFSFMLQPQNGVPILPFYHLAKDRQLVALLQFLKQAVKYADMRDIIRETFFWDQYLITDTDPRKIFLKRFSQAE